MTSSLKRVQTMQTMLERSTACLEGVENALQHWSIPHDPNDDDVDADGDEAANITLGRMKLWRDRHCPEEGAN